jgi:hypothetical protein
MINVKKETAERLKEVVDEDTTFQLFSIGLITEQSAKRFLIADDYKKSEAQRGSMSQVKGQIADRYCVSIETVHKYLAKSRGMAM